MCRDLRDDRLAAHSALRFVPLVHSDSAKLHRRCHPPTCVALGSTESEEFASSISEDAKGRDDAQVTWCRMDSLR